MFIMKKLRLDLHEDARRYDQAVKCFDGAGRRLKNIDHALMCPHLKLLAALLINVRAAKHRISLDAGGNRDRPAYPRVGPLGVIDDLLSRRVERAVVVGLHTNSDSRLLRHKPRTPFDLRIVTKSMRHNLRSLHQKRGPNDS